MAVENKFHSICLMLIKEENIVLQKLAGISECFFSLDK